MVLRYVARGRARQLFFVNGKLDAVETDLVEPIGPLARVARIDLACIRRGIADRGRRSRRAPVS
jgi:hypothetical protein